MPVTLSIMTILLALAVLLVVYVFIVALQPADFCIARSAKIPAPPGVVFAQVNDFHVWGKWSPWAKLDPEMKQTYTGPTAGSGAGYAWRGNKKVGEGRMTILDDRMDEFIRIKLEFLKPFAATNTAEFTFTPDRGHTIVTWSMTGTKNFLMKGLGLFMNMDKMVGGDFEKGLAQLTALAESAAAPGVSPLNGSTPSSSRNED
jgi:hypothetical protein